jgi:methyltransferase-like protein/SAM-dependent methyltransferase
VSSNDTTYNDVPYLSKPLFSTYPDLLAVSGRLRGLKTPSASACRVLELGCAAGGNLIPMAYALPGSRFVGIDLSERQINEGKELCQRLKLPNIELKAESIADLDDSIGEFDYIICHGVFSWVPPPIQDKILWICRHRLSPNGVAYISYNTNPGWHLRRIVRDLMKYHAGRFEDPATKVQQARSILNFMAQASASLDSNLSRLLADEAEDLPDAADYYLFHEHLEEYNQAFYFHEFVAKARNAGLEYLGEAWHHTQIGNLPADVQETLQALSNDLIELEQFVDFIRSRTFRRTLLCHHERQIVQTPPPSVMYDLFFTALARPESANADILSFSVEKFILDDGTVATTNMPLCKAALMTLFEHWPNSISFDELLANVNRVLEPSLEERTSFRPLLAAFLANSYVALLVAIHCEPFPLTTTISERPRASNLVRTVAASQARVTNLRHRLVVLSPLAQVVAQLADGTRTIRQIGEEVQRLAPHLFADQHASEGDDANQESRSYERLIDRTLYELARSAVLEA